MGKTNRIISDYCCTSRKIQNGIHRFQGFANWEARLPGEEGGYKEDVESPALNGLFNYNEKSSKSKSVFRYKKIKL